VHNATRSPATSFGIMRCMAKVFTGFATVRRCHRAACSAPRLRLETARCRWLGLVHGGRISVVHSRTSMITEIAGPSPDLDIDQPRFTNQAAVPRSGGPASISGFRKPSMAKRSFCTIATIVCGQIGGPHLYVIRDARPAQSRTGREWYATVAHAAVCSSATSGTQFEMASDRSNWLPMCTSMPANPPALQSRRP